jgi:hypothetical protein
MQVFAQETLAPAEQPVQLQDFRQDFMPASNRQTAGGNPDRLFPEKPAHRPVNVLRHEGRLNIDVKDEVTDAGFTDTSVPLQWRDIWLFKIGAEYKYSDALSLRAGYTYVQTPVPDHIDRLSRRRHECSIFARHRKGAYLSILLPCRFLKTGP